MKIRRKGAAADHGYRTVEIDWDTISFNSDNLEFIAKSDDPVRDFSSTGSSHTYQARITLDEWLKMTKSLAKGFKDIEKDQLDDKLIIATAYLTRIINEISGKAL